ncbi:DUF6785 family protein [Desulfovibrio inopinatus]|uniref:DUF6785 family protein n=1 Tax=Desulfovibrio inopinatus TaxID=102109 RepID=UPI0004218B28|nr:DUF6785 family protein [Desulfovibrio inopinatus]
MHTVIRLRALLLGVVLGVLICLATPYNNSYLTATLLAGGHFPLAPFFILVWLTIIMALLTKFFRGWSLFTGLELLVSWVLMVVVSGIPYTGLARTFFVNLTAPTHFATLGNRWTEALGPLLPKAWYPNSQEAVESLYNGLKGGYSMPWTEVISKIPWDAWLPVLGTWAIFILLCYFVMVCLVNLFSRQWISNERMNFPLLTLPRVMEEALDEKQFFHFLSDKYLLTGILVPVVLHTINGWGFYDPSVPTVPTLILAGPYFPGTGLFSGFSKLKIYIYPAFIGFAYMTARQISFSFWLFYLAGGLLFGLLSVVGYQVPASALGVTFGPTLQRPEETQMIGGYIVFFLFLVWLARFHLLDVARRSIGMGRAQALETEWFSSRLSFWGVILGGAGLVAWSVWFGMSLVAAVCLMLMFFIFTLVATRVICQGGIAYFTLTAAPIDGILAGTGSGFFSGVGLAMAAVMQKVLFVDLRESLMPSLLHASKVSEPVKNKRMMFVGIAVALVLGVTASFGAFLFIGYKYGFRDLQLDWEIGTVQHVYDNVQRLIETPAGPNEWVVGFAIVGAIVMLLLLICYQRFYWWPIHPIGYLTMYSSAMRILWFSFVVGWMCNHLTLRYGGVTLFRRLRLFFIGLVLGDFLMGGTFAVIGLFMDQSYQVLPN